MEIETFANPAPARDYVITHTCPEFTSVCPKTGQPDFGTIELDYVPDQLCLELKSLKLYINKYRNEYVFHEAVVNQILDDLVALVDPLWLEVVGDFTVRGNIHTVVSVRKGPAGYEPPPKPAIG